MIPASETLKSNLRYLIASTSYEQTYKGLMEIFREDYEFLQKFYGKLDLPKKVSAVVQQPSIIPSGFTEPVSIVFPSAAPKPQELNVEEAPKIRADTKVRIVKKPTSPEDLPQAPPAQEQPVVENNVLHTESGFRDPKDIKKWQKEQEENKANELRASGISPASLLTEANMRKWIVDEKKTFAAIARNHVGLSEIVISAEAKKYGLQSENAKKRNAILVAKKAK
jgi:hypothetical protein